MPPPLPLPIVSAKEIATKTTIWKMLKRCIVYWIMQFWHSDTYFIEAAQESGLHTGRQRKYWTGFPLLVLHVLYQSINQQRNNTSLWICPGAANRLFLPLLSFTKRSHAASKAPGAQIIWNATPTRCLGCRHSWHWFNCAAHQKISVLSSCEVHRLSSLNSSHCFGERKKKHITKRQWDGDKTLVETPGPKRSPGDL